MPSSYTIDLSACCCDGCDSCAGECGNASWVWGEDGWLPNGVQTCSCGTGVPPDFDGTVPGETTVTCCTLNRCIASSCCPTIPSILYLTITDSGTVIDGITVPLIYGLFLDNPNDWGADWGLTSPDCGAEHNGYRTLWGCNNLLVEFYSETFPGYCGPVLGGILVESCSPFFMSGTGAVNQSFTSPACNWVISE